MKILKASQIRRIDAYTIDQEPISSAGLMERAAGRCFEWIRRRMPEKRPVRIFCGMGNNGGDGLVIARLLADSGHQVVVHIVRHSDRASEDFLLNEERLVGLRNLRQHNLTGEAEMPAIDPGEVIVDALLGSGLDRPLEGLLAKVVQHINASSAVVVAIDFPTGLFCEDNRNNDPQRIVRADYTLSFQSPKLAFMFPSNDRFLGEWYLLDIGLHPKGIAQAETRYHYLQASEVRGLYRPRKKFSHKGHFGHGLLLAGSHGKAGAGVLAARAALRSGAGLMTVHLPGCAYEIMQTCVPEAMCVADENPRILSGISSLDGFNAIAVGPGIGTHEQTARALKLLIQNATVPMVLDADALNILSENLTWCGFLPKGSIFTPHPGEFDRMAGKTTDDLDRFEKALELAHRFQVYVVLKGGHTAVVCPDGRAFFNSTGNPGLATGGTGDVLTGVILGWLAQNYSPLHACLLGVYLHGRAADLASARLGQEGLIASDVVELLPRAIKTTMRG